MYLGDHQRIDSLLRIFNKPMDGCYMEADYSMETRSPIKCSGDL